MNSRRSVVFHENGGFFCDFSLFFQRRHRELKKYPVFVTRESVVFGLVCLGRLNPILSRTDSCSVNWVAKLPTADLNFAVEFWVDCFVFCYSMEKGSKKSTQNSLAKFTWKCVQKPFF